MTKQVLFFKMREQHKQLVSQILADRMAALDRATKKDAVIDSFGSLLASLSSSDGHCLSCGQTFHLFNSAVKCCICRRSFCGPCLRKETDRALLELIDPTLPEDSYSCERCSLFCDLQKEKEFRKQFRALKEDNNIKKLYATISQTKEQIKQLIPQYQYLATSITEIKISGTSEKEDISFGISYPQVKLKEKKLLILFKDYEEGMKQFELESSNELEQILLSNIKKSLANFLRTSLITFQEAQKQVSKVELKSVIHIYTFFKIIEFETRPHSSFSSTFKKLFDDAAENILRELKQICTDQAQRDWEKTKIYIDGSIKKHQQAMQTSPQNAKIQPPAATMSEPKLLRKVTSLVAEQHKKFITRAIHAPITAGKLSHVLSQLEKRYNV
eukprot:TRINITY_DN17339_c0_g1_i2.p1 TRINITY_DN17339_c0_g1~~TRINITY_DN17339_c0_g1_i2.p1  ORF type:complete len:386 (-),score=92.16 TRINITY_DN17339_c0_g1_i2:64-1221(-)